MSYTIRSLVTVVVIVLSTLKAPEVSSQDFGLPEIPGPAVCHFELKGQVRIDGMCQIDSEEGDIFLNDLNQSGYIAMVGGGFGEYYAYWNGKRGAPIASEFKELGSVKRVGTCWISPNVTICIGNPDTVVPNSNNSVCDDCG
jgi:hypothetical protein